MIQPEEFIAAAAAVGLHATLALRTEPHVGVNVFGAELGRVTTTVWWPGVGPHEQGFIWGDSFQYGAAETVTAAELAELVKRTTA